MTLAPPPTWAMVAFDHSPFGVATVDHQGRFVSANAACCALFGMTLETLLTQRWVERVHVDDRTQIAAHLAETNPRVGEHHDFRARHLMQNGVVRWLSAHVTSLGETHSGPSIAMVHFNDESAEHFQREMGIGSSRAIALMSTDASADEVIAVLLNACERSRMDVGVACVVEQEGVVRVIAGDAFPASLYALLQPELGKAIARSPARKVSACDGGEDLLAAALGDAGLRIAQVSPASTDGSVHATLLFVPRFEGPDANLCALVVAVLSDAVVAVIGWDTARRRERETERRLSTMLRNLPGMAYRCANETDWPMSWVSEGAMRLTGHPPAFFTGDDATPFAALIHDDDQESVWDTVQRAIEACKPFQVEYRIHAADGSLRWMWERGEAVVEAGERVALEGFILDMTPYTEIQAALRASEEKLRTMLDGIDEGVIATCDRGLITHFNPCAEVLIGVSNEEAMGQPIDDVVQLATLDEGEMVSLMGLRIPPKTYRLVNREKKSHQVICSMIPLRDHPNGEHGFVCVIRDITERTEIERQLHHVQRMDAIGQLAGGIAHDFNNLLTGIMGYADLLRSELRGQPALADFAETILQTSRRAAALTSQLLTFSRRQPTSVARLDAHKVIEDAIELLRRSVSPQIELETALNAPYVTIEGDHALLQNAFINLGVNARDAVGPSGVVRFETRLVNLDSWATSLQGRQLASFDLEPGIYLAVSVSDDGPGIPSEMLHKVFEPFFTTKAPGKGTGLGLPSVYGTVKSHRGAIVAGNRPEGGAVFTIYLPIEEPGMKATTSPKEAVVRGQGTILLIEDEEVVRRLLEKMLTTLGYDVVTAADGETACQTFEASPDGFSLVIMDMMLPGLSGAGAIKRMVACDGDVRILVASGNDASEVADRVQVRGVIQKPFDLATLSQKVADVLG